MRKIHLTLLIFLLCFLAIFLVACDSEIEPVSKVDFIVDDATYFSVEYNANTFILPPVPTKDNMVFMGWYFDTDFVAPFEKSDLYKYSKNGVVTLYAKFMQQESASKITLTLMDGKDIVDTLELDKNKAFSMPKAPQKQYFNFIGWYKNAELTNKIDNIAFQSSGLDENTTIYAKYLRNSADISLYVNGKKHEKVKVYEGLDITLPTPPIVDNMTFHHWNIQGTNDEFDIKEYQEKLPFEDISLDGVYVNNSVTITIKSQDNIIDIITLYKDDKLELSPLDDTNKYIFDSYTLDGKAFDIDAFNKDEFRGNITLDATWNERITTVTYMVDSEIYKTTKVDSKLELVHPASPLKPGFIFSHWALFDDKEEVKFDKESYINNVNRKDITLVAVFTKVITNVSFYIDEKVVETSAVNIDNKLILPANFQKEGYIFLNWMLNDKPFDVDKFNDDLVHGKISDSEIKLVARYTIKKATIHFIANFEEHALIEYDYNGTFNMPSDPTLDGYTFDGWYYDDQTFEKEFDKDNYLDNFLNTSIALYAKFTKIETKLDNKIYYI